MANNYQSFLGEISKNPDDEFLLRAFADYLENEEGDPRGSFVRLQIERAAGNTDEYEQLGGQLEESYLLQQYRHIWEQKMRAICEGFAITWEQGCMHSIGLTSDNAKLQLEALLSTNEGQIIRHITGPDVANLATLPPEIGRRIKGVSLLAELDLTDERLMSLRELDQLEDLTIGGQAMFENVPLDTFSNLERLDVSSNRLGDKGLRQIAQLPQLKELNTKNQNNHVSFEGLPEGAFGELQTLNASENPLTEKGLQELAQLPRLEQMDVSGCYRVTFEDLPEGAFRELQTLNVSATSLTDSGLANLGNVRTLEELEIRGCRVTFEDLPEGAFGELRRLDFGHPEMLRHEGMVAIAMLPELEELSIAQYNSATLEDLPEGAFAQLKKLNISKSEATDTQISSVANFPMLEELNVEGCSNVTFEGLPVEGLRTLKKLDASSTGITKAGLMRIAMLPELEELDIANCGDIDLKDLPEGALKKLKSLNITYMKQVGDEDLQLLATLPHLEALSVNVCQNVTFEDLPEGAFPALKKLNTHGAGIKDAGLMQIAALPNLEELVAVEYMQQCRDELLRRGKILIDVPYKFGHYQIRKVT